MTPFEKISHRSNSLIFQRAFDRLDTVRTSRPATMPMKSSPVIR